MHRRPRSIIFALIGALGIAYFVQFSKSTYVLYRQALPDVSRIKTEFPIRSLNDYAFQKDQPNTWNPLNSISEQAVSAILMSEDANFYNHKGYDPKAIREAYQHNQKEETKIKRGASTITQQVIKNLFLTPEKTISRKIRELLLAVELERKVSKKRILETYLNIAHWGPGIYGITQAAREYFRKSPANLTAWEGAVLAFMLPNPNRLHKSVRNGEFTVYALERVETILERMWRQGLITDSEYASAGEKETLSSNL